MEIGGPLSKVSDLGRFIRDQRRTARLSLRKMSEMAGISNPYLSQIERGMRRPSAEILKEIAKALRVSAETLYVKAGILEERDNAADPVTSILNDHAISDKQKQVLIEIYQSFRHENDLAGGSVNPAATAASKSTTARRTGPRTRTAAASKAKRTTTSTRTRAKARTPKKRKAS